MAQQPQTDLEALFAIEDEVHAQRQVQRPPVAHKEQVAPEPGPRWTAAYRDVLHALENGSGNVFITGRAGSGKTTLIRHWLETTRKTVAVVAPTGIAALNAGGETIHRFCRMKPNTPPRDMKTLDGDEQELYRRLDTVVVDEISMVRADVLDCLDRFLRRNGPQPRIPFGGCQLVMLGDLGQLEPVVTPEEAPIFSGREYKSPYFFDAKCWRSSGFETRVLAENFRQSDAAFGAVLDAIRDGTITSDALDWLNAQTTGKPHRHPDPVHIVMTNEAVDRINQARLKALPGYGRSYAGEVTGVWAQLPTDELLRLKEGARVMMLNNDPDKRWVNGSMGHVIDVGNTPTVELDTGEICSVEPFTWEQRRYVFDLEQGIVGVCTVGEYKQIPMRLAWAVTAHKTQSATLDNAFIDWERGTFSYGQAYVALSRCRTLAGLRQVRPLRAQDIRVDPLIKKVMAGFTDRSKHGIYRDGDQLTLGERISA